MDYLCQNCSLNNLNFYERHQDSLKIRPMPETHTLSGVVADIALRACDKPPSECDMCTSLSGGHIHHFRYCCVTFKCTKENAFTHTLFGG